MNTNSGPIVVTGASGLVGSNLILEFVRRNLPVAALYGRHPISVPGVRAEACDLTRPRAAAEVLEALAPSLIVHCAASTDDDWCEQHPEAARRINTDAAAEIAHQARSLGAALVYISTDSVFDGVTGGYTELDPVAPVNQYARSKVSAENLVLLLMPDALVLRVNVYGWNLQPKYSLAEWALARLENGELVPGFADVSFSPVLVNCLADWVLRLCETGCTGIYHLGSSDRCTKREFAAEIADVFHLDPSLVLESRLEDSAVTASRPRHTWLRTHKAAAALGHRMPTIRQNLEAFRALRREGFPEKLKSACLS